MGDDDGKEETPAREWEVVSMTESTYAAASGMKKVDMTESTYANTGNTVDQDRAETSHARGPKEVETSHSIFTFGDSVFPPSQHENLPLEPEIINESENQDIDEVEDFGSNLVVDDEISFVVDQVKTNTKGYHFPVFDARGNLVYVDETELVEHDALQNAAQVRSLQSELSGTASAESLVTDEVAESNNQGLKSSMSNSPNHTNKGNDESNLPCRAWWNRKLASLYVQVKEGNGVWSVCITAAIVGLLILGQQWQQERWQLLQMRWHSSLSDEKLGRMLGPVIRLKDLLVGGQKPAALQSFKASTDH